MMIDCKTCRHWDSFEWHAVIWHRVTGGFLDEPITEHVETCSIGLSAIEDGRAVSSRIEECKKYEATSP